MSGMGCKSTQTPASSALAGRKQTSLTLPNPHLIPVPALPWSYAAIQIQPKLRIGNVGDPLERQADAAAAQVMGMPDLINAPLTSGGTIQRKGFFGQEPCAPQAGSSPAASLAPPVVDEALREAGAPLAPEARAFYEPRFAYDFSSVRIHSGQKAAASARALGASAYTVGRNVVFGAGEYAPATLSGKNLLAHELSHVVQQTGAGQQTLLLVQRSPLSDSIKTAWAAEPTLEALLARLSNADVQNAQGDTDVDAELTSILSGRADDLWVAQRVRQGRLGQTSGALGPKSAGRPVPRPIEAHFFRGVTDRRMLVIAGVHGSESQGVEVAQILINDLQKQPQPPRLSVIVVPSLFPDNAARGEKALKTTGDNSGGRESGSTPTNRNFPSPSEDLAAARAAGGGKAVDASVNSSGARTRAILPENLLLLELIERFKPERIVSIHGTWRPGEAGVFYDPRSLGSAEREAAGWAAGTGYAPVNPSVEDAPEYSRAGRERRKYLNLVRQMTDQASNADRDLTARAATQIDTATASIQNRASRDVRREKDTSVTFAAGRKARSAHPSVAGNVGPSGALDNSSWGGGVPGGVSLGGYAPARGVSVFTVEPPIDRASKDYPTTLDKVTAADRRIELQSYADAVRTILLGD
jgi:hypothetical protein